MKLFQMCVLYLLFMCQLVNSTTSSSAFFLCKNPFTPTCTNHLFLWQLKAYHDLSVPVDMAQLDESARTTRILTTDFPHYFAVVTRVRQEVHAIGPEGGMVSSSVVPQVQAVFPQGALTKKIKVGLQVNLFKPRKNVPQASLKKITVNHVPKKKRFSLVW